MSAVDSLALSPVVAPGEVARDVAPEAIFDGGANDRTVGLAGEAVFEEDAKNNAVGLAGDSLFRGKANRPVAALAGWAVIEGIENKLAAGWAVEAALDGGNDDFVAGPTGLAVSASLTALAGVKPKPKPVVGALVGEVLNRLDTGLGGDSAVTLIFEAPKRPLNGDFDGLGAMTFTTGELLWLPNLIGLSAFHV